MSSRLRELRTGGVDTGMASAPRAHVRRPEPVPTWVAARREACRACDRRGECWPTWTAGPDCRCNRLLAREQFVCPAGRWEKWVASGIAVR